jgi:hypothetical protein
MRVLQAAYNNSSEVELNDSLNEEVAEQATQLGEYSLGTKVAIKFDDDWWEGEVVRYDAQKDLYTVLYTDGIFEDLNARETRQGVQDHKEHMQPADATDRDAADRDAADGDAVVFDSEIVGSSVSVVSHTESAASSGFRGSIASSVSHTVPAEMVAALTALTAAAERLTTAADRIITHSSEFEQQQRVIVQQQQQTHMAQQQEQHHHLLQLQQQHMHMVRQQQLLQQQQQQSVLLVRQQQQLRLQHLAFMKQQQQQQHWCWQWR